MVAAIPSAVAIATRGAQAAPADFDHAKLARTARTEFIIPGYERLAASLDQLDKAVTGLCRSPGAPALATARDAFRDVIANWGYIEVIKFGPVASKNRLERIFYWPDRKSIGRRQVARVLRKKDVSALDQQKLAQKSVAVQGLTALELVLHGSGADRLAGDEKQSFRCRYGATVVANLRSMTSHILNGWRGTGGFAKTWLQPGPDNPAYFTPKETTLELVKVVDHELENIRDRRIAPVLGFGANRKRKSRPVLWRSGLSMVLIDANIRGIRGLFVDGGLSDAYIASKPYDGERAEDAMNNITNELTFLLRMSGKLVGDGQLFSDPKQTQRLVPIGYPLRSIRANAVGLLKSAAGLSIGFNASDGD